jgi:hypothetical protein
VLALWIAHCHAIAAFSKTSIANIRSPTPECGKTILLEILEDALPEGKAIIVDPSPAFMFRKLGKVDPKRPSEELEPPILILDEAENVFYRGNPALRDLTKIFNSGYKRGKYIGRAVAVKDADFEPGLYRTFGPKVIAGLTSAYIAPTTLSRCIRFPLKKRLETEPIEDWDRMDNAAPVAELHQLRDDLAQLLHNDRVIAKLTTIHPDFSGSNRYRELVKPLFTIAAYAGGNWPELSIDDIPNVLGTLEDNPDSRAAVNERLIIHIKELRRQRLQANSKANGIHSKQLCEALNDEETWPWGSWNSGTGIQQRELASHLADFDIHPDTLRIGETQAKGYKWNGPLQDAIKRYAPSRSSNELTHSA